MDSAHSEEFDPPSSNSAACTTPTPCADDAVFASVSTPADTGAEDGPCTDADADKQRLDDVNREGRVLTLTLVSWFNLDRCAYYCSTRHTDVLVVCVSPSPSPRTCADNGGTDNHYVDDREDGP